MKGASFAVLGGHGGMCAQEKTFERWRNAGRGGGGKRVKGSNETDKRNRQAGGAINCFFALGRRRAGGDKLVRELSQRKKGSWGGAEGEGFSGADRCFLEAWADQKGCAKEHTASGMELS